MRGLATADRIRAFLARLGGAARGPVTAYLTGGSTAVTPQAVAKLERGHGRDLGDVGAMLDRGLVTREGLVAFLDAIEDELYRFPAIDPPSLRRAVEAVARGG